MSGLRELYQEVILDHAKNPRNRRAVDGAHAVDGHNPLCGDRLTVYLRVDDGVVQDVAFEGAGCAISTATTRRTNTSEFTPGWATSNTRCMV